MPLLNTVQTSSGPLYNTKITPVATCTQNKMQTVSQSKQIVDAFMPNEHQSTLEMLRLLFCYHIVSELCGFFQNLFFQVDVGDISWRENQKMIAVWYLYIVCSRQWYFLVWCELQVFFKWWGPTYLLWNGLILASRLPSYQKLSMFSVCGTPTFPLFLRPVLHDFLVLTGH